MERLVRIVSCCGQVGRVRTEKALALLPGISAVISVIVVSEEFWEEKPRLHGDKLKQP